MPRRKHTRPISVDAEWQAAWNKFAAGEHSARGESDDNSKVGHLALWVAKVTGVQPARFADALTLLDPASAPGGVATYVDWKRHDCPGRKWTKDVSVKRGGAVLARFFDCAPGTAATRIAEAFRAFKP